MHEALAESGLPASLLEIEITESTLQRIEHSRHLLDTLKAMGVSIAIDDFGTGYSSLSVIKHLPIDRLKIDQSFVRDIPGDAGDVAIVEAIVSLSRALGLRVIAEGVETEAQLAVLRHLGCEEGQGICSAGPCLCYKTSRVGNGRGRSLRGGEMGAGERTRKPTRFRTG